MATKKTAAVKKSEVEDDSGKGASTTPTTRANTTVVTDSNKGKSKMDNNSIISLDINLEDFEDYEVLPDGGYPGECVLAEVRTSDRGNSYFYTNWKIDPADYPVDYDKSNAPEGVTLNYSRVQVPTAADRRSITQVKRLMSAMGLSLKTAEIDCSQWVGKKAMLNVGHENYQGEDRNRVIGIESENA